MAAFSLPVGAHGLPATSNTLGDSQFTWLLDSIYVIDIAHLID
jgi:hypothetical protein